MPALVGIATETNVARSEVLPMRERPFNDSVAITEAAKPQLCFNTGDHNTVAFRAITTVVFCDTLV